MSEELNERQRQLAQFYSVESKDALIEAQANHIGKLQAQLHPLRDMQTRNPRA